MSKIFLKLIYSSLIVLNVLSFLLPNKVYAQALQPVVSCKYPYVKSAKFPTIWPYDKPINASNSEMINGINIPGTIQINFTDDAQPDFNYFIKLSSEKTIRSEDKRTPRQQLGKNSSLTFEVNDTFGQQEEYYSVKLMHNEDLFASWPLVSTVSLREDEEVCDLGKIYIYHTDLKDASCSFTMPKDINRDDSINAYITSTTPSTGDFTFAIIPKPPPQAINLTNTIQKISADKVSSITPGSVFSQSIRQPTPSSIVIPKNIANNGDYTALIYDAKIVGMGIIPYKYCAFFDFKISNNPTDTFAGTSTPLLKAEDIGKKEGTINRFICTKDNPCSTASGKPCDKNTGFITALGCIHTTPAALVSDILKFATGIGGGLAFMMMLLGAFQMLTSGGNPQNLQGGKDVLQNAIIGLLFIIFSILLMKIIGIDILNIPGFG